MHDMFPDVFRNRGSFERYRKDVQKAQRKARYIKEHYGSAYEYEAPTMIYSTIWKDISMHQGEIRQDVYEKWMSKNLSLLKSLRKPTRDIVDRQRSIFLKSIKKATEYANVGKSRSSYGYFVHLIDQMSDRAFGKFISGNKALKSILEIAINGYIYDYKQGLYVAKDKDSYIMANLVYAGRVVRDKRRYMELLKEESEEQNLGLSSLIARATNTLKQDEKFRQLEREWRRIDRERRKRG